MAGVHLQRFSDRLFKLSKKEEETAAVVAKQELVLFLTDLLTITLTCKRFFHALLLTWFQIKRVAFNFLDNVFCLHLTLEASQGILKGFAFLYSNLCQEKYTSNQSQ
jgi:hypothetical protein